MHVAKFCSRSTIVTVTGKHDESGRHTDTPRTTQDGNVGAGWSITTESKERDLNQDDCRDTFRTKRLALDKSESG